MENPVRGPFAAGLPCWHTGCQGRVTIQEKRDAMKLMLAMTDSRKRVLVLCLFSFLALC